VPPPFDRAYRADSGERAAQYPTAMDDESTGSKNTPERPSLWQAFLRRIARALGVAFVVCGLAGAIDFFQIKAAVPAMTGEPALHPLAYVGVFVLIFLIVGWVDSEERHFVRSGGTEGLRPHLSLLGVTVQTKDLSAYVSLFVLVLVVYLSPHILGAQTKAPSTTTPPTITVNLPSSFMKLARPTVKPILTIRGHEISSVTPHQVEKVCDGYTSLECDKRRDIYKNKWVRWSGTVEDVNDQPGVLLHVPSKESFLGYDGLSVFFKERERDEVIHMRVGDEITVLGKLNGYTYDLEDADLLENKSANRGVR
jgi:hypothetical protein